MFWENLQYLGCHVNHGKETATLQGFGDGAAKAFLGPFRAAAGRLSPTNRLFWK